VVLCAAVEAYYPGTPLIEVVFVDTNRL